MSTTLLSLLVLAAMFALGSWKHINIGTLAFPGALLVGICGGLSTEDVISGFPVAIFLVIVGVTYLFAIAQVNGTIDWLLDRGVRLLNGRTRYLPCLLFLIGFGISATGPIAAATVTLMIPIAIRCAYRYGLDPFMTAMVTLCGVQAGYFSPIALYSVTVTRILESQGLTVSALGLFAAHFVLNTVIAAVVFVLLGGFRRRRHSRAGGSETPEEGEVDLGRGLNTEARSDGSGAASSVRDPGGAAVAVTGPAESATLEPVSRREVVYRWATLFGLLTLAVGIIVSDLDPGLLALSIGAVLMLSFAPGKDRDYVNKIAWPTCFMLAGILTYITVMQEIGTFDIISDTLTGIGGPKVGVLLLSLMTGLVSVFASSAGTVATTVPLVTPVLGADPSLSLFGSITTLTSSAYLVDANPLNLFGALLIGNVRAEDQPGMFRKLIVWAVGMVIIAPVVTWAVLVWAP